VDIGTRLPATTGATGSGFSFGDVRV
jgi:hypothetical protein